MREFAYSDADFARIRTMIRSRAGIALSEAKQDMVYGRMARLVRGGGYGEVSAYLDALESRGSDREWQAFVNALTTNLTSFFREAHHFDILARHLGRAGAPPVQRIWCAGSSTGEEAWSIAITACETFDSLTPPVEIIATDIDTDCLAMAQAAIYPIARVAGLSETRRRRFFQRGVGHNAGQARMLPALQRLVRFIPFNLMDAQWPLRAPLDGIFCRNTMIYFDKPTQRQLLERMAPMLYEDGLLFAGHSETFFHANDIVRACGQTVFAPVRAMQVGQAA